MIKKNIVLAIITVIVFSGVFSLKFLAQLDSVYFHPEAYSDLVSKISIWGSYDAPFGGVHMILWLYPVTYLAATLGKLFSIDWNILVRIFFYVPSILISFYSIQKLGKYFKFSNNGKFLMSLIYVFNTYYLMLVDGGQLGIMLAYSIFPLAIESVLNYSFFKTTTILTLLGVFDPRFLLISLLTGVIIDKFNIIKILKLIPVLLIVVLINFYWILPLLNIGSISVTTFVSSLKLTSFVSPLFLYQPHWPYNEFGKVTTPNILFLVIPTLLVLSSLFKPTKEKSYWMLAFIFFSFLLKGESDPFGFIYSKFLNGFSIATVFRDSTKFFAPLIVLYSLIVSRFFDSLKNKIFVWVLPIIVLIPLVPGLIVGGNNNLKGANDIFGLFRLKEQIKQDNLFSRTVYIPRKPQLAYQTEDNQAIDGRVLANYLPFASDNYGSEDRFNFMLRNHYLNYFRSLGIDNAILISKDKPIIAKIENSMPEKYYIDKLAAVVGSPIGVEKLVPEYGVVFLEDGKTNLNDLFTIPNNNIFFYLNNKSKDDLVLSGFKNKFIDPSTISLTSWAKYTGDDYLMWKYQLLIREIDTKDINYGGGIIMSTVEDEFAKIDTELKANVKYKIFIRALAGNNSKGVTINGVTFDIPNKYVFSWIGADFLTDNNINEIVIKNKGGFNVVGQILIIEEEKYQEHVSYISDKLKKYGIYKSYAELPVSKISFDPKIGILIFNQGYNPKWVLGTKLPFAINSITNGFYVSNDEVNLNPVFVAQKILDFATTISLASVLVYIVSYFGYAGYLFIKNTKKNN